MVSKLISNGTLLAFDDVSQSVKVLNNGSILIEEDEIVAIGEDVKAPAGAEIIDVTGKIVSPGLHQSILEPLRYRVSCGKNQNRI